MARAFASASSEGLYVNSVPLSGVPLSMAGWFNVVDATNAHAIVALVDQSVYNNYFALIAYNDLLRLSRRDSDDNESSETTANTSDNTWHHGLAVAGTTTSGIIYLDGANSVENTVEVIPTGLDRVSVGWMGDSTPGDYANGSLAEIAIWNAALTAAEAATLAAGYSPLLVRPQSLVFYLPLIRDDDQDLIGGLSMTELVTPTVGAHPRIIYPTRAQGPFSPAPEPPAGSAPLYTNSLIRQQNA